MESLTSDEAENTTPENGSQKKVPGRIGVYERPQGLSGSVIFAGIAGLVALVIIALLLFVMFL